MNKYRYRMLRFVDARPVIDYTDDEKARRENRTLDGEEHKTVRRQKARNKNFDF